MEPEADQFIRDLERLITGIEDANKGIQEWVDEVNEVRTLITDNPWAFKR
ncbi:MAG TPA: hypothetical protein VN841_10060 [Bryobacteraceae bacterium]|nr:hypothetical protein [Bryobacteraceae bacterium]